MDRLGFFTEVGIDTQPVPGSPDQVDLTISVAEKPTGNLSLGAGLLAGRRPLAHRGIRRRTCSAAGNYLGMDVNTSKFNRQLVFSTTNPYFTPDGISRSIDAVLPHQQALQHPVRAATTALITTGCIRSVRFGVPFTEPDTVFFGAGVSRRRSRPGTGSAGQAYQRLRRRFGETSNTIRCR